MAIDYKKFAKEFLNVMKEEAESNNTNRRVNDSYDDEDEEEYEVEFTSVSTNSLPDGKKGSGK